MNHAIMGQMIHAVVDSSCIEWTGARDKDGYGKTRVDGKDWRVPRLVWTRANGSIPDGMQVLHHCDNPPCYNLDHLWLGTNVENNADKMKKGRHPEVNVTHCPQGHQYTPDNIYIHVRSGARQGFSRDCRQCTLARERKKYAPRNG